jgi:branched-chain amino acid transport system substrate-binding protein
MATELAGREVETIGLVTSDDRYGSDGGRELREAAATLGIEVPVYEVVHAGGVGDLAGLADRVAGWSAEPDPFVPALEEPAGLDAVVLWTPEQPAVDLAVALRGAGWDGPLWLDMAAAGDLFYVGEVASALTGARLLASDTLAMDDVVASVPDLAKRRDWFDGYLSRYGTYHAGASYAADALDLIVEATGRIGTDPARVRDTLEALRLSGRTGPVGFTPANHSGFDPRSLAVLRFTEDRWHASAT